MANKDTSKAGAKPSLSNGSEPQLPNIIVGKKVASRESIVTEVRRMFRRMEPLAQAQKAALVTGLVRAFFGFEATLVGTVAPPVKLMESASMDLELDVRLGAEKRLYALAESRGRDYARAVVRELVCYVHGHAATIAMPPVRVEMEMGDIALPLPQGF